MREHFLKTWPNAFAAVKAGTKRFEWRKDDRGFEVGDILVLCLFDQHDAYAWDFKPERERVEKIRVRVTYILRGMFGVPPDYCVMSIEPEETKT